MRMRYSTPGGVVERWEVDQRHTGPWHARGKTRFRFVQPPVGSEAEALLAAEEEGEEGPMDCDGKNIDGDAETSSTTTCGDRFDSLPWRSEYRRLVLSLPAREVACLTDHSDEVLDLQWSPDGKFLATCSRDCTTIVYDVTWVPSAGSNGSEQFDGSSRSNSGRRASAQVGGGEVGAAAATVAAASATAASAMAPFLTNHRHASSNGSISPPSGEDLEVAIAAMRAAEEAIHEAAAAFHDQEDAQATRVHLPPHSRGAGPSSAQSADEATEGQAEHGAPASGTIGAAESFGSANGQLKLSMRFLLRRPQGSACVCRLNFSPDSAFLLCCTEEPHGNPFSPVGVVVLFILKLCRA